MRLIGAAHPFASYGFLSALEDSGAVGPGTGWTPAHLVDEDGSVLPLYLKHDSFGEFVFDWAWADAWQRMGLAYYPKWVATVPYSPVSAPKVLVASGADPAMATARLFEAARSLVSPEGGSSLHALFLDDTTAECLAALGFTLRHDCQFHWHNRDYCGFDDFLARFRSAKRKDLRKERARVAEGGLRLERLAGGSITPERWTELHALTARSFMKRGNLPYLNAETFRLLGERLGDAVQVFAAFDDDTPVAAAWCLRSDSTLYGRYWGATVDLPGLHFELCFYRGIEYCIEEGLHTFEPGAQGEHKLARGFDPVRTTSAHWIGEPGLRQPIGDWCARERVAVESYIEAATAHLPFHRA